MNKSGDRRRKRKLKKGKKKRREKSEDESRRRTNRWQMPKGKIDEIFFSLVKLWIS